MPKQRNIIADYMLRITFIVGGIFLGIFSGGAVFGSDISTATHSATIKVTNTGTAQTNLIVSFDLSTQSLVDGSYIESDALNTEIHDSAGTDIIFSPATRTMNLIGAFNNASGDETSASSSSTTNDLTFPTANGEVYDFGLHYKSRILRVNTGRAGVGTYTITWKYYDGTSWNNFSNVTDNTVGFTVTGAQTVSYDVPADWTYSNLHSINAFWIRAEITAFTSITTTPLGTQVQHETGQWWVFLPSTGADEQVDVELYTGGTDLQTYHNYFPGDAGVTTPDASNIELGNSYAIDINAYFDTSAGSDKNIIHKPAAYQVYVSSAGNITVSTTGSGTNDFWGETSDGLITNQETTYERSRDESIGDSVNTSSTTLTVGQTTSTTRQTQTIGNKLDDPS